MTMNGPSTEAGPGEMRAQFAGAGAIPPRPAARRGRAASPRQTSEAYFEAAFEILGESGAEAVTVANLCDRLGVTKGSFYYHFLHMSEFIEVFVEYWERSFVEAISAHSAEPDPLRRMSEILTTISRLSHEAEAALRAWGHSNDVIGAAQRRMDQLGEKLVRSVVGEFIADEAEVSLVAHQATALAIGLQHRPRPIDRVLYLRCLVHLAELTCGVRGSIALDQDGPRVTFERR